MIATNPAATVQHLPTFDAEEFAGMTTISRLTPKANRAETFRLLAVENTAHAEGLVTLAAEYAAKPGDFDLMAAGLAEGAKIRLAAAEHCHNMAGAWAYLHGIYGD